MDQRVRQPRKNAGKVAPKAPKRAPRRGSSVAPPVERTRARGLDRAIHVLQLLHAERKPMSIGAIAKRLKAPRSTIYEIVNRFRDADLIEYAAGGAEVFFGRAIYLYANDYFTTHAVLRLAQEEVRRLAAETGETTQFCMPIGNKYAVVSMQNSARLFRIGSEVGALVPIPWTASGRLFIAHMSLAELTAFIPPEDFRTQDGRQIDAAAFLAEAKAARARGICIISGLVDDFATCIAAPVVDRSDQCMGTMCFIVSRNLEPKRIEQLAQLLVDAGRRLSGHYALEG